ncbi:MAG: NAD(P)/FAD-dependent oxidoreductase [Planctomycetaceae bacterium]|nr:NAD(P)/FAD-dependent oxidoreductase [Planctomycetaceae bacterium]
MDSYEVVVIGAGAAGLLAAAVAAERGRRTLLLEKNRRPGVKILMSGGTRCNITHATDKWGIVRAYRDQGDFLHSALAALGPADLVKLIEDEGVPTKVEETGKVFPVSNRATDVLDALVRRLVRSGAEVALDSPATAIERDGERFLVHLSPHALGERNVSRSETPTVAAAKLILTTGGQSYPGSGTTGDGYGWAAALGHMIVPPRPALVPLTSDAAWVHSISGVTIPDVAVALHWPNASKPLDQRRGSLLFTHFGLSGPVILDISRTVTAAAEPRSLALACDFLPDTRADQLDGQIRESCSRDGKKQIAAIVAPELPRRLVEQLIQLAGLPLELKAAELSKKGRADLVAALKSVRIPITGTRGFAKAEVTAGGIALDEIDSRTMQSKLVPSLYLAGEILDLDGPIGGYNFQAAFSTGYLAGMSV